jgi:LacI family transcriptional regulator
MLLASDGSFMHRCLMNEKLGRISHRLIALEARVSQATVSRALKNDPRISEAVRRSIQDIAERLGYRPDPHVSKLMAHMRSMQETHFQSLLGFILPLEEYPNPFMQEVVQGARSRAKALGYVVDDFRTGLGKKEVRTLNRVLRARGVEGIIIFSRNDLEPPPQDLDLTHLAAVNCSNFDGVLPMHRVRSGHFENMECILEELVRLKSRRPGLVTFREFDRRQRWAPRMGYYHFYHDLLNEDPPPIFDWHEHLKNVAPVFMSWFREVRPDILLAVGPVIIGEITRILKEAKIRKNVPMLSMGHTHPGIRGINEKPANLGSAAVDVLTSHIIRNEKGWPKDVKVMSLLGTLH